MPEGQLLSVGGKEQLNQPPNNELKRTSGRIHQQYQKPQSVPPRRRCCLYLLYWTSLHLTEKTVVTGLCIGDHKACPHLLINHKHHTRRRTTHHVFHRILTAPHRLCAGALPPALAPYRLPLSSHTHPLPIRHRPNDYFAPQQ